MVEVDDDEEEDRMEEIYGIFGDNKVEEAKLVCTLGRKTRDRVDERK